MPPYRSCHPGAVPVPVKILAWPIPVRVQLGLAPWRSLEPVAAALELALERLRGLEFPLGALQLAVV